MFLPEKAAVLPAFTAAVCAFFIMTAAMVAFYWGALRARRHGLAQPAPPPQEFRPATSDSWAGGAAGDGALQGLWVPQLRCLREEEVAWLLGAGRGLPRALIIAGLAWVAAHASARA